MRGKWWLILHVSSIVEAESNDQIIDLKKVSFSPPVGTRPNKDLTEIGFKILKNILRNSNGCVKQFLKLLSPIALGWSGKWRLVMLHITSNRSWIQWQLLKNRIVLTTCRYSEHQYHAEPVHDWLEKWEEKKTCTECFQLNCKNFPRLRNVINI